MKQQEVFRKTGEILKELSDQYEDLKSNSNALNDLELELFIANAHFLIDHAEILRKLNLQREQQQHTLPPHVEEKKLELPKPAELRHEPAKPIVEERLFDLPKPADLRPEPVKQVTEEVKKPTSGEPKYFEPLVQQAKPTIQTTPFRPEIPVQPQPIQIDITPVEDEKPVTQIDLSTGTGKDSYTLEQEDAPIIKHNLFLDESDKPASQETNFTIPEDKPMVNMEDIFEVEIINTDDETQEPNIVPTNPEPVIDNTPKVKEEESVKPQEPVRHQEPVRPEEPVKENKPLSFNERMSAQLKGVHAAGSETSEPPIKDIKSAISLNDKLLFVKDLFNGYSLAYSEAIEIVNRFNNFEEADRFLKTNYVTKNNWEGKKATMDKFYALLKRRYA